MTIIRTTLAAIATATFLVACGQGADNDVVRMPASAPAAAEAPTVRYSADAMERWSERSALPASYYPHGFDYGPADVDPLPRPAPAAGPRPY